MLIIFNSTRTMKQLLKNFKMSNYEKFLNSIKSIFFKSYVTAKLSKYQLKNKYIKIQPAPEPSDILWSNLQSSSHKTKWRATSYLISYGILAICAVILVIIKKVIKQEQ